MASQESHRSTAPPVSGTLNRRGRVRKPINPLGVHMQHSWKKTILAAALALAGAQAGAVTVWTLDNASSGGSTEGLTYTLTGDLATGSFNLSISGINVAGVDTV